jgi:hypothetical protein
LRFLLGGTYIEPSSNVADPRSHGRYSPRSSPEATQGAGFILSVVGAILLLLNYRVIRGAMAKA